MRKLLFLSALLFPFAAIQMASAEVVGKVGTDWVGNDIVVEAIEDPEVKGVVCYVSYFDRSIIDRLQHGNWFEDPSNSAIDCHAAGPIEIGDIALGRKGEEVFSERRSLVFKTLVVQRIYDARNKALVYLAHSRQIQEGSAKMAVSSVPLSTGAVKWLNGEPVSAP